MKKKKGIYNLSAVVIISNRQTHCRKELVMLWKKQGFCFYFKFYSFLKWTHCTVCFIFTITSDKTWKWFVLLNTLVMCVFFLQCEK